MTKILTHASGIGLLSLLTACSAKPEDGSSGRCAIQCSNARVGAAEFQIQPLAPSAAQNIALTCTADFSNGKSNAPTGGPLQVKFKVVEIEPAFGSGDPTTSPSATSTSTSTSTAGSTSGSGSSTTSTLPAPLLPQHPVGGVGFEPWVYGDVAAEKSAPEFLLPGSSTQVSSFKYAGIVTPSAEWCSDTCGIITYEFWPNCANSQTPNVFTAGAQAQGATLTNFMTFTLTLRQ